MRIFTAALIGFAGSCTLIWPAVAAFTCADLERDTQRAMEGWQVPGLSMGIIRDGKIMRRQSFGVRDTESGAPVTPKTMFGTGSLTKSLTALGTVLAAQDRLVRLDRPVQQILPYFPGGISLRHLLSHTAGWPRHDALWYLDRYSGAELAERLSRLPRFTTGGRAFQYNNVPFAAVGVALEQATGTPWQDWIRARILDPAGMTDAMTGLSGFRNTANRASPYFPAEDGRISLPLRDTDPVAPAAGLYAHLDDMLRYLELFATDGVVDGKRLIPATVFATLRTPVTARYGLGLRLSSWNGQELAFHPGFVDGYGARLSILPKSRSGVIVLSNMSGETPVAQIVSQTVLDCLIDAARTDWVARFGHRRAPANPKPQSPAPQAPDRDPAAYTGAFVHTAYGHVRFLPAGNGQLAGHFHGREFLLDYAGDDRWRLTETHWPLREGLVFSFEDIADGRFAQVSAPLADGPTYSHKAGPIMFERNPLFSGTDTPD
jgi:CubicO group peptidase (beta-lactamase class C family)